MVQKLDAIKGGGGSIRVGTTGTISALMTREMESIKSTSRTSAACCADKAQKIPVSVACVASNPKRLQMRKSLDEASSSIRRRSADFTGKTESLPKSTHHVPMLGSDNLSLDRTPRREKTDKKLSNIVEIVDIKCGHADRAWATPITHRLKKLGFSKLSESIV
ncbi:hypothetical protein HS088_TW21G00537 [Tripterygium wilfordii]|uniref:Uncharacterized protein n=1 Tax=Tripterygium wilfordii TaxID=458696 RepID=A0A7J7C2K7_TRIWF|nr:uncharacterized protein LOC119989605 [Tripterygium wilfordii]XP_038691163.1 uncharacterized protein LOC119989605 [Tripterygium wilfordii]KAF5728390.1 hypothetical protein HS088_TW21G00537 [Tripterygium wilfordii]